MSNATTTLTGAIRACLPHCDKTGMLPTLAGIRLHDGVAHATDRYTLAEACYDVEYMDQHDVFVPIATAKLILAAKSEGGAFTLDDDGVGATLSLPNGQTFHLDGMSTVGDFPTIEKLFPADVEIHRDAPATVGAIALNSDYIAKFGAKHFRTPGTRERDGDDFTTIRMGFSGNTKPVLVNVGNVEWFRGLIVPIRMAGEGE